MINTHGYTLTNTCPRSNSYTHTDEKKQILLPLVDISNVKHHVEGHGVTFGAATLYYCADHVHNCHLELLAASYWARGRVIGAQLPHLA